MINGVACDGIFTFAQENIYLFSGELSERRLKLHGAIKNFLSECFTWEYGSDTVDVSRQGVFVTTLNYASDLLTGALWYTLEQIHDLYSLFERQLVDGMHLYCILAQKNFERMLQGIRDAFVGTSSLRSANMMGIDRKAIINIFSNVCITVNDYKLTVRSERYNKGLELMYMRLGKISDSGVVPNHPNLVGKHIGIVQMI